MHLQLLNNCCRAHHICKLVEAECEAVIGHVVLHDLLIVVSPYGQPGVLFICAGVDLIVLLLPSLPLHLHHTLAAAS